MGLKFSYQNSNSNNNYNNKGFYFLLYLPTCAFGSFISYGNVQRVQTLFFIPEPRNLTESAAIQWGRKERSQPSSLLVALLNTGGTSKCRFLRGQVHFCVRHLGKQQRQPSGPLRWRRCRSFPRKATYPDQESPGEFLPLPRTMCCPGEGLLLSPLKQGGRCLASLGICYVCVCLCGFGPSIWD